MRKSALQLYAPFLVLALVQALLIVVAPSRGGGGEGLAAGGALSGSNGALDLDTGGIVDAGTTDLSTSDSGATGTAGGGGAGTGTAGKKAAAGGGGGAAAAAGDTSHCVNGQQVGILRVAAPCAPSFSGPNGGATYQGVTDTEIKIVYFSAAPNEQVDAILATQGLAVPEDQLIDAINQFVKYINDNYELYGRRIVVKRIVGDCPTTPPDYDKCIAAAQQVVKEKPFAVVWVTSLYATVFDVWSRAGIISIGGSTFDSAFYNRSRPFRYDVGMDGTKSADHIAEYYCKKMAGKPADHAGSTIHATMPQGRSTKRHLGIVVPEIEANVLTAKRVQTLVDQCNGADPKPELRTYESNIETATTQTQATVSALISAKVTTVVCMCDPIAPVFLTAGMTGNGYFPEFLLPGLGLLDYDLLGRLYDPQQMQHAFGPSNLAVLTSLDDTDQARVWRATGRQGHPCGDNGCGLPWTYLNMLSIGLQMAGPKLDPLTFERGMLQDLPDLYTSVETPFLSFAPNDYTGYEDAKEVYWDPNAPSKVDGEAGAYVPLNGGQRYRLSQWSDGLGGIPVR